MKNLILALQILVQYRNPSNPISNDNGAVVVSGVSPKEVPENDKIKLSKLGFFADIRGENFISYTA